MIRPDDVDLIIFDLGGTIISEIKPDYEAVRRAFKKLGWEMPVSEVTDFSPYMALPSNEFYQAITPPEKRARWQEAREMVRREYYATFLEFSEFYPGVKQTLASLNQRGLRLAVYSRAESRLVIDVVTKLGIEKHFIYLKQPGDDVFDKENVARKIITGFKAKAAIVGDRMLDIEVAGKTGALSVGVLYGYGGKEMGKGDFTLNRFSDLLGIFSTKKG